MLPQVFCYDVPETTERHIVFAAMADPCRHRNWPWLQYRRGQRPPPPLYWCMWTVGPVAWLLLLL